MGEIRETNTIRAPLPTQGRSFRPQYGDALDVTRVGSLYVETANGRRVLTKEAQAIPADSVRQQAGQLTDPAYVRRQRLQPEANKLEEYLLRQPQARMRLEDLERNLRTELPAVAKGLQKARTRLRPFLRLFPGIFRVEGGVVIAVNAPAAPPEPPPEPPEPPPETGEERNARLDALLAASREREERARAARAETQRARLAALRGLYDTRAR